MKKIVTDTRSTVSDYPAKPGIHPIPPGLRSTLEEHQQWLEAKPVGKDQPPWSQAMLCRLNLEHLDLRGWKMQLVDLREAYLAGADLTDTDLSGADLRYAHGLAQLQWDRQPKGIGEIRQGFRMSGMRTQERELTYAIRHNATYDSWLEQKLSTVLFELTCAYGMAYGRPLRWVVVLTAILAIIYTWVAWRHGRQAGGGIYRTWPPKEERVFQHLLHKAPERVSVGIGKATAIGALFSVMSAVHIGWRDLNFGNWLVRMLPKEHTYRATGWVRMLSGVQSLVCVYLIALSALSYFGHPFE